MNYTSNVVIKSDYIDFNIHNSYQKINKTYPKSFYKLTFNTLFWITLLHYYNYTKVFHNMFYLKNLKNLKFYLVTWGNKIVITVLLCVINTLVNKQNFANLIDEFHWFNLVLNNPENCGFDAATLFNIIKKNIYFINLCIRWDILLKYIKYNLTIKLLRTTHCRESRLDIVWAIRFQVTEKLFCRC